MLTVKKNKTAWVPVTLFGFDGLPIDGATYDLLQVEIVRADGTQSTLTVTSADWRPLATGLFASSGLYELRLPTTATTVEGLLYYAVRFDSFDPAYGSVQVISTVPYVAFDGGGETINPTIVSAIAPRRNAVIVTFSEPVLMTTAGNGALNIGNYRIDGLLVISVTQQNDRAVIITTSTQTPGTVYPLTVLNIEDLNGNPIAPAE
jgi:hypothetical protein